jgi:hypothetical protein
MVDRISLADLSILIAIRLDGDARKANLKTVLRYFTHFFTDLDIIVIESGGRFLEDFLSPFPDVTYHALENETSFHKTKYFNLGARLSERPYISCYDADVLFDPTSIQAALDYLKSDPTHFFCFPYNGEFWDIQDPQKQLICETFDFSRVPEVGTCIHPNSPGGATFFQKNAFLEMGGYNETFISWGWEDDEIVLRFTKLGFPPARMPGICVHMHHPRGPNSSDTHPHFQRNFHTYKTLFRKTPLELCHYIQTVLKAPVPELVKPRAAQLEPLWLLKWVYKVAAFFRV